MHLGNKKLGIIGILVSIIGTFALMMSSFEYSGTVLRSVDGIREYHPLFLDKIASIISVFIIIFGFLIQLLEKIWDWDPINKYQKILEFFLLSFSLLLIFYFLFYKIGNIPF